MTTIVGPDNIARIMGLAHPVHSLADLSALVQAGLPKSALRNSAAHIARDAAAVSALIYRVVPEATYKRRRANLKPAESERTERLARVIATAEYVWDDETDARDFLTTPNSALDGQRPVDLALYELGARRVEELLWKVFYGLAA